MGIGKRRMARPRSRAVAPTNNTSPEPSRKPHLAPIGGTDAAVTFGLTHPSLLATFLAPWMSMAVAGWIRRRLEMWFPAGPWATAAKPGYSRLGFLAVSLYFHLTREGDR